MKNSAHRKTHIDETPLTSLVATLIEPIALPWHARTDDDAAGDSPAASIADSFALYRAARAQRSKLIAEMIVRAAAFALRALSARARRFAADRRRRRETRASREMMSRLDDHTLRDLGLHRSKLALLDLVSADAACAAARHPLTACGLPR
jgi:hypothetical protein